MLYHVSMKTAHLLENEQGAALFDRFLPGMRKMVENNPQAATLSVEQLVRYTRIPEGEKLLAAMNAALEELNTPENRISPAEAKLIAFFQELDRQDKARETAWQGTAPMPDQLQDTPEPGQTKDDAEPGQQKGTVTPGHPESAAEPGRTCAHVQDAVYPGKPWLDTKGERIQAHGGAVYYEDGVYYWYGENKEHTDGRNGVWTWGLKVYSSTDLCNWDDRGFLIPPVLDDPDSALFPTKRVDRPHILKCPQTGKYVCWIKLSGPEAAFTIWQANRLLGPYEMVENLYNPGGHKAGDFDMISDEATGKGYLYFDADHTSMLCMELSGDYLHAKEETAKSYPGLTPPFTREAPALFAANGKKYMLTSGMTGYVPNQSDSAVSEAWDAPFESVGNPHAGDADNASFNSQISKVFKVEGTDNLFIAMADRWLPRYHVDARIADLFTRVIASNYAPDRYQATDEERREMYAANELETADTSIADYVWLPLHIEKPCESYPQGRIWIEWRDRWTVEELAEITI